MRTGQPSTVHRPKIRWPLGKARQQEERSSVSGPPSSGKNRTEEEDRTSERLKKCGGLEMSFGFKNLEVWKVSKSFAKDVYELTSFFPSDERFGLVAQLRRAAISVMSNIAEGAGRKHKKEFDHFLYLARGSLNETVA